MEDNNNPFGLKGFAKTRNAQTKNNGTNKISKKYSNEQLTESLLILEKEIGNFSDDQLTEKLNVEQQILNSMAGEEIDQSGNLLDSRLNEQSKKVDLLLNELHLRKITHSE